MLIVSLLLGWKFTTSLWLPLDLAIAGVLWILFQVLFYKILILILALFEIDFMTTGDFLLKYQDPISYNNLILYFEIDKINFEEF